MVNGFEEEVKALEEYGHDCCARIDDRIHECCKRIREAHEQELDNTRYAYEVSLALMKKQPSPLGDLCGIRKEGDGDVDTGGRDETGGDRSDAAADGHMADSAGGQVSEGVAPITAELRETIRSLAIDDSVLTIGGDDFHRICDAIDAVHAQLERDYKVACEVNERQDEQYADMVHKLDRAYEKNRNQRRQLTEVQEALHRRNEGELKARWQKEVDRLEHENEELRCQLESLMFDSRPMTDKSMAEHGWVRLPLDADGVPIRFGDKVTVPWSEKVYEVSGFSYTQQLARGERTIWVDVYSLEKMRNVPLCGADSCHHYHAPTVEDVLTEFGIDWEHESDCEDRAALLAEYAAKLRLAGDAE